MLGLSKKDEETQVGRRREAGAPDQVIDGAAGRVTPTGPNIEVYWPLDFLSSEEWCKSARLLAYGYESKVTKGYANSNKNDFFAHAKDLMYALSREKPARRPVIFVAHSLGGLLVKEVRFGITLFLIQSRSSPVLSILYISRGVLSNILLPDTSSVSRL